MDENRLQKIKWNVRNVLGTWWAGEEDEVVG